MKIPFATGDIGYAEDDGQTLPLGDFRHLTDAAYYLRQVQMYFGLESDNGELYYQGF